MNSKKNAITSFRRFGFSIVLKFIILMTGIISAQNLEETLQSLAGDPAKEFVRPLADAFGADINTGWLSNAPSATRLGLDFRIGLVAMGAFIDKDQGIFKLLDTVFPFQSGQAKQIAETIDGYEQLTPDVQFEILKYITIHGLESDAEGPTVFGSKDDNMAVLVKQQNIVIEGNSYQVPEQTVPLYGITGILQNPGIFPTIAPQLSIGTVYGTQATLRYIPKMRYINELGKIEYIAGGIQHNPLVWFNNPLPVDFSLAFFLQKITIENLAKTTSTAFGLNVSKPIGGFIVGFTPYAGFLYEKTNMDVKYEYYIDPNLPPIVLDFEIEGANKARFILGFNITFVGLNIYADYNFSKVNTLNLSVLYGF